MNLIGAARRLIALESTPEAGNAEAALYAATLCREAGLHVEEQREFHRGLEQINVIARPTGGRPARELMLQTHLDTASAGHFGHWTKTLCNPFAATSYGDELFGLGTASGKLDFLAKLEALAAIKQNQFTTPPVLVGTFGAGTGMAGAIKLLRRKKVSATAALIGAPTQNRIAVAGAGRADVEITIPFSREEAEYRRAHDALESSSTQSRIFSGPQFAGQNAIQTLLDHLAQLPDGVVIMDLHGGVEGGGLPAGAILEIDLVSALNDPILPKLVRVRDGLMALGRELGNRGAVHLSTARASESDITLTGHCRLGPSLTDETLGPELKKLETLVRGLGATLRVRDYRPGFLAPSASVLLQAAQVRLRNLGGDANVIQSAFETEANVFCRLGVECLVFGPGESAGPASANESVRISEVKVAAEFYRGVIERFCV